MVGADIARTVFSLDYALESVEFLPAAGDAGDHLRRLTLARQSKSKSAGYGRVELIVAGEDALPQRALFFDASGQRHLKTGHFLNYREVLGRRRPLRLRVVDHLDNDRETILQYADFAIEDTPDAWFQPAYLKRLK